MHLSNSIMSFAFLSSAAAAAFPNNSPSPGCGKGNVIFTGMPYNHPIVSQMGFDPKKVEAALKQDAINIIKAGYNLRVVLFGPEQPVSRITSEIEKDGVNWDVTGVGYGVRGARSPEITVRLEDIIQQFRDKVPKAPIVFDYSPDSAEWAIKRRLPLAGNCTNSPGKDLGFAVYCDICK